MTKRVYILSADDALAAQSDYGPGWANMWKDDEGRRLLPFRVPPEGYTTMTTVEAIEYLEAVEAQRGGE